MNISRNEEEMKKLTNIEEGGAKNRNLSNFATKNQENSIDKFSNSFYNDYKERTENKNSKSMFTLSFDDWKKKNRDVIKYAGDGTMDSIKEGFADTSKFMKDAGESSNLEDVENASIKWKLAYDSGDSKLCEAARNEMIGCLSDENKGEYLKDTIPLSVYIDAKDRYDYDNGNFTTTKYLDTKPDEKTKQIQNQLNYMGYTDKFGNPLKEDGIAGAKTLYAFDKFDEDTKGKNSNQVYMKDDVPLYSDELFKDATLLGIKSLKDKAVGVVQDLFQTALIAQEAKDQALIEASTNNQRAFWKAGAQNYLRDKKKYYTSAWLLEHSLQDNPPDVERGNDSRIAYLINHSNEFSDAVSKLIKENKKKDKIQQNISVTFEDGDLAYSLHKADIYLDGYKKKNGEWLFHCTLEDTYDYTELNTLMGDSYFDVGTVANNAAYVSQHTGAINPYKIKVDFYATR